MNLQKLLLPLFAILLLAPRLHAQMSPVTIRVDQVTSSETDRKKFEKTQKRSLRIYVTNGSAQDMSGLKVKYYYFGKEMKDHDSMILEQGEKGADVKSHKTETVETPAVTATSTEEHFTGGGGNGKGRSTGKKVEASGKKITGHGVQVIDNGKVIAEMFTEPGLKSLVGGGGDKK